MIQQKINAYLLLQEQNTVIIRMLVEVANFHPKKIVINNF